MSDVVQTHPTNQTTSLINKGISLDKMGRYAEAIKYYDEALAIDPNSFRALNDKGTSLDSLGRYKESMVYFDKALSIIPNDYRIIDNKINTLVKLGMRNEAMVYVDKALSINPNDDFAIKSKAIDLSRLGRYGEAITYFDKSLKINPNDADALDNKVKDLQALKEEQPQARYLRYENKTYGINIDYPSTWNVGPVQSIPLHPNIKVINFASRLGSLSVIEEPLPYKGIALNEYVSTGIHMLKGNSPNFQIVQDLTPTSLSGYPAYEVISTFTYGNLQLKAKIIATMTHEHGYIVMYENSNGRYNASLPIAQRMIDSFKIINIGRISNNDTNMTGTFLRFQNNTYGISMDYPSGWLVKPVTSLLLSGVASPEAKVIGFVSPLNSSGFIVQAEPLSPANISLYDSTRNGIENAKRVFPNFHIVQDLTPTTLAGYPAYKVVGTFKIGYEREFIQITTKAINKRYSIMFSSPQDLYNASLPIAQRMINSFKISSNLLKYKNDTYGISMDYPSDWLVNPPSEKIKSVIGYGEQMFRFVSPEGGTVLGSVVQPLITNTSKEYIDAIVDYGKHFVPGFKIENLNSTTLGGHQAYQTTYSARMGKIEIKSMEIAAIIDEKIYDISFTSKPDLYNAYLPIVEKMINSFSYEPVIAPCMICSSHAKPAVPQIQATLKESDDRFFDQSAFVVIPTQHMIDTGGTMHIFGKIKNGGTSTINIDSVGATLSNSARDTLAMPLTLIAKGLGPGELLPFELKISSDDFFPSDDFKIASIEYHIWISK